MQEQRDAGLVVARGQCGIGGQFGCAGDVVRAFDGSTAAPAVGVSDGLDGVLDPDVQEQRPLAVLADLDEP